MEIIGDKISDAVRWRAAEALRSVEDVPGHGKLAAIGTALYGDAYLKIPGQMALSAVCTRLAALIEPIRRPAYEELLETAACLQEDAEGLMDLSMQATGPLADIAGDASAALYGLSYQIRERDYAVVLWFYAPRGFPDEDAPGMKEALKEAALERSAEIARRAARICEERKVD